jgi:hypothetical protein
MKPRVYEVCERGVSVRLHIGRYSMMAEAKAGRFMRPVRVSGPHPGLLGPGTRDPHETAIAKGLVREAADKVLGVVRRGAFELLIDELHAQRTRARPPLRKSVVFLSRRRAPRIGAGQRVIFFSERAA